MSEYNKSFKEYLTEGKWKSAKGEITAFEDLNEGHLYAILNRQYSLCQQQLIEELRHEKYGKIVIEIQEKIPENIRKYVKVDFEAIEELLKTKISPSSVYVLMSQDETIQAIKPEAIKRGIWDNVFDQRKIKSKCKICNQDMTVTKGCTPRKALEYESNGGERCHDCGACSGHFHHPGCDVERCIICKGQLISCDCEKK